MTHSLLGVKINVGWDSHDIKDMIINIIVATMVYRFHMESVDSDLIPKIQRDYSGVEVLKTVHTLIR